jgi:hypothetical protein
MYDIQRTISSLYITTPNITYINHPATGHISQKAPNKLPEDGILNAETWSEKRQNYME